MYTQPHKIAKSLEVKQLYRSAILGHILLIAFCGGCNLAHQRKEVMKQVRPHSTSVKAINGSDIPEEVAGESGDKRLDVVLGGEDEMLGLQILVVEAQAIIDPMRSWMPVFPSTSDRDDHADQGADEGAGDIQRVTG